MGTRTALSNSRWIAFGILAAALWLLASWFSVYGRINWNALEDPVGAYGFSGIVGLVVVAVSLGLLVALYGELAEGEPGPDTFPPE